MRHGSNVLAACVVGLALALPGCLPGGAGGLPAGSGSNTSDNSAGSDGSAATGDGGTTSTGGAGDGVAGGTGIDVGENTGGGEDGTLSGTYDPQTGLQLASGGFSAVLPPGVLGASTVIDIHLSPPATVPGGLPGGVSFAGMSLEPEGLELVDSIDVVVPLGVPTLASVLPVVTFDSASKTWVSGGGVATVDADAATASFAIDVLGTFGVPNGVPAPPASVAIGSLLTVTNQGAFTSNVLSASDASLFYSAAVGGSLSVNVMSPTTDSQGQIAMRTLSLAAVSVRQAGNTIVAEVGGSDSFYNTGDFRGADEPAVGVMLLGFDGTTATLTVYVATPERVIAGTLSGPGS